LSAFKVSCWQWLSQGASSDFVLRESLFARSALSSGTFHPYFSIGFPSLQIISMIVHEFIPEVIFSSDSPGELDCQSDTMVTRDWKNHKAVSHKRLHLHGI
jgi:hypothetical protein